MAFTVEDFEDLYRLLSAHPEWRTRLRPLILGDEYVQMPERLSRLEAQLILLGERMDQLGERMDQLGERMDQLVVSQQLSIERMDRMDARLGHIEGTLGRHDGKFLELKYFQQFGSWFGRYVRGARQIVVDELEGVERAVKDGTVSQWEVERLYDLDFLVRGRSKATQVDELLAVEVSTTVRVDDVTRAHERAETLRRAGYAARGMVGGVTIEDGAKIQADELGVVIDLHPSFAA